MYKVISFDYSDKPHLDQVFLIRKIVFIDEQEVDREEEFDAWEESSRHYLAFENDKPAGTARWRRVGDEIKLERFCVLPEFRNKGVGAGLVRTVLDDVIPLNKKIFLNSQVSAMNLYAKAGFVAEGDLFYEVDIPHYKMVYRPQK